MKTIEDFRETFVLVKYVAGVPFYYCGHQKNSKDEISISFDEAAIFLSEKIAKYVNGYTTLKNYEVEAHSW